MWHIQLMSTPEFLRHGVVLPRLNTHYFEALLGGLLLEPGRKLGRDVLGFRFWPAQDEVSRRRNLRQLLYRLREAWPEGDQVIEADKDSVAWRNDAPYWLDVERLEFLIKQPPGAQSLEEIWTLYRGPLMERHRERWILPRRRGLEQDLVRYFRRTASWADQLGEQLLMVRCLESLTRLTPDRENLWAELARGYARLGNTDQLEAAGERYVQAMRTAGGEPLPETLALFVARPTWTTTTSGAPVAPVGRETEWDGLRQTWSRCRQGAPSVALIRGGSGLGKTSLLHAFRRHVERLAEKSIHVTCHESRANSPFAVAVELLKQLASEETPRERLSEQTVMRPRPLSIQTLSGTTLPAEPFLEQMALLHSTQAAISAHLPLLITIDDAQWCDRESLAILGQLLLEQTDIRLMLALVLNDMTVASHDSGLQRRFDEQLRLHHVGWETRGQKLGVL